MAASDPTPSQAGPSPLAKGTYAPATPTDLRSPCPMVNCLANHGYLPRDGRDVHARELFAAVRHVGLSTGVAAGFAYSIFGEQQQQQQQHGHGVHAAAAPADDEANATSSRGSSWWWTRLPWTKLNPLARLGMRRPGQTDAMGRPVLDLDQLALPGAVEHDISLTRRDHQQPQGNNALQMDLVEDLLRSSADGKTITREDLAVFRTHRIAVQQRENPDALYKGFQHLLSCGEISLILDIIGNGASVPVDYAQAFLQEERLPIREGWTRRRWWKLGFVELQISIFKVWRLIDYKSA